MAFLFVVKDLYTVDVWENGRDPDTRIVVERNSFIVFKGICHRLNIPCLEVLDSDLVVEG